MLQTLLIVIIALGLAFAFARTLTRRLISTWHPEGTAATTPAAPRSADAP